MSDDWEEDEEDWEREGYEYGDDSGYYSEQGDSDKDFRAAELKEETFRGISEGILVKLFGKIWTIRNFRAWESLITYRMRKTLVYVPKFSFQIENSRCFEADLPRPWKTFLDDGAVPKLLPIFRWSIYHLNFCVSTDWREEVEEMIFLEWEEITKKRERIKKLAKGRRSKRGGNKHKTLICKANVIEMNDESRRNAEITRRAPQPRDNTVRYFKKTLSNGRISDATNVTIFDCNASEKE